MGGSQTRAEEVRRPHKPRRQGTRAQLSAADPYHRGWSAARKLFVRDQKTPVRIGLRGGAGRTRTSNQFVMNLPRGSLRTRVANELWRSSRVKAANLRNRP